MHAVIKPNRWDDAKMGLKLPTLLEADYKTGKEKMVAKMAPWDSFHCKRHLCPGEALSVYLYNRLLLHQLLAG